MRFAIIAAGEGARLEAEGVPEAKPLVEVGGERLIDRLLRVFTHCGATDIAVIFNRRRPEVERHLLELQRRGLDGRPLPLRYVAGDTPSSMHSFHELLPLLQDGGAQSNEPFILTTVDTIFDERRFAEYVRAFAASEADGVMGVTDYIDDEKPLYVKTDDGGRITAFLDDDPDGACRFVSAGIYGLRPDALKVLRRCVESGRGRMRNFQRALLEEGMRLTAFPFGKVFDIDHRTDIDKANAMRRAVGIYRAWRFSPNMADDDKAILDAALKSLNRPFTTVSEEETEQDGLPDGAMYLSMARSDRVLDMLQVADAVTLNSAEGVRRCRDRSWQEAETVCGFPRWIKRAACAQSRSDVRMCRSQEEYDELTKEYKAAGERWIEQLHYEGDLVKFYAVADGGAGFFRWYYAADTGRTKFGQETSGNAAPHRYPFDADALRNAAAGTARRVGVRVYGGDAVVLADGEIRIIDFNDWPSFAPCRDEAARAIAAVCGGILA